MNITDKFAENARKRPGHPAVEDGNRIITYAELGVLANAAAANLLNEGIEPGDFVGIALEDSVEHIAMFWALARIGAVMFSINGRLLNSSHELGEIRNQVRAVVTDETASNPLTEFRIIPIQEVLAEPSEAAIPVVPPALRADHPLRCVQSSGTTGKPKYSLRSHSQYREQCLFYRNHIGWTAEERYLALVEMSFSWGGNLCLAALYLGATIVISRARDIEALLDLVRTKRITAMALIPEVLRRLLDYAAGRPLLFPHLRSMVTSSSAVTPQERLLARRRLATNVIDHLSTCELGPLTVATPADQDAYPQSVGRVVNGVEAEVVNESHRPLPPNCVGLIRFRADHYPTEYRGDPEATARSFRDGWFYPMDLAAMNEDGYVFLKGRADDMISMDGIKFYPIEVENVLLSHHQISEAAVFGWPSKRHGAVAAAAVVTSSPVSDKDLVAFCRSHLAAYKVPRTILFVPRMPRNPMGKILKTELKEALRRKLAKRS